MISGVTKNMVFESRVYVDRYSLIHCAHDHPQQSPFESDCSAVDQKSNNVSHITTCAIEGSVAKGSASQTRNAVVLGSSSALQTSWIRFTVAPSSNPNQFAYSHL